MRLTICTQTGSNGGIHRQPHGFTLVELLAVVSIMALLTAVLMPTMTTTRGSSRRMSCATQLRQIYVGGAAYAADHQDVLPLVTIDPQGFSHIDEPGGWFAQRYLDQPVADFAAGVVYGTNYVQFRSPDHIFRCPSAKDVWARGSGEELGNFDMAYQVSQFRFNGFSLFDHQTPVKHHLYARLTSITSVEGGRRLAAMDCATKDAEPAYANNAQYVNNHPQGTGPIPLSAGANCLFGGGAVEWLNPDKMVSHQPYGTLHPDEGYKVLHHWVYFTFFEMWDPNENLITVDQAKGIIW